MADEFPTPIECAHAIIEIVPRLSRPMRQDLRRLSAGMFTQGQFRVLAYLFREGSACLSDLADTIGVSLPTMSKLMRGLESRGLVVSERDSADRRRVSITLTDAGREAYEALLRHTERHIVTWIRELTPEQRAQVVSTFKLLDEVFSSVEVPPVGEFPWYHPGSEE